MLKLAARFIIYYKIQSFSALVGLMLSIALLCGASSLLYSGQRSSLENCRTVYGGWNCRVPLDSGVAKKLDGQGGRHRDGYQVETYGCLKNAGEAWHGGQHIRLLYADAACLELMNCPVVKGRYPGHGGEVAMDQATLDGLGFKASLGGHVTLGSKRYRLCGVLESPWDAAGNWKAFVSKSTAEDGGAYAYLELDGALDIHKQLRALADSLGITEDEILCNSMVNRYLCSNILHGAIQAVKELASGKVHSIHALFQVLKDSSRMAACIPILGIGIFGLLMVYSIFYINLSKRACVYGVLKILGIGRIKQYLLVLVELWALLLAGFPLGAAFGNLCAKSLYQKFNTVFLDLDTLSVTHAFQAERFLEAGRLPVQGFMVSRKAFLYGFLFLACALAFLAWQLTHQLNQLPAVQAAAKSGCRPSGAHTVYSRRNCFMAGVVNRKFLFSKKSSLICILVSMSFGGSIFLCTNYVIENAKENNRLQMQASDGVALDYKIYVGSSALTDTISQDVADAVQGIPGIKQVYPVKSYAGELLLQDDEFLWKTFFNEINSHGGRQWGGICRKLDGGGYALKASILGYDDQLLNQLAPYLVDGTNPSGAHLRSCNGAILVALEDGIGNYGGIAKKAGDAITLDTPKETPACARDLKLKGPRKGFERKKYTVCAVASRALLQDSRLYQVSYVGQAGVTIIMTNKQMEQDFGILGYRTIGLEQGLDADGTETAKAARRFALGAGHASLQDYTSASRRHEEYLHQKLLFYYSIAAMCLLISMFHMMNAVSFRIFSRRHEFGILRAMGLTGRNIAGMMARQGFAYGCMANVVMAILYALLKKAAGYFMVHEYGFLASSLGPGPWAFAAAAGANLLAGLSASLLPAFMVLREDAIHQVNMQ